MTVKAALVTGGAMTGR